MESIALGEVSAFGAEMPAPFHGIVGSSRAVRQMIGRIAGLAAGRSTILIVGESGSGKELVARAIHQLAAPGSPFVALNCAALPRDLIESELFGYVKGAFSGASQDHPGLFRSAHSGTLFLDEVTEMHPETQAKLLRAIQERCVRPVGAMREVPVDVRIVASTNRDAQQAIRDGQLRKDLYYRLAVGVIQAPPLRDRLEDIPLLLSHFIDMFNRRLERMAKVSAVEPAVIELLRSRSWPGNVRELANAIEAAMSFAGSEVLRREDFVFADDLGTTGAPELSPARLDVPVEPAGPVVFSSLKKVERDHIVWTLYNTGGNKALAARMLGISRKSLYDRLAEHGLGDMIRTTSQAAAMRNLAAGR
ncbi:MAG TPA: sigma 54-interacting transcriptional regulator [Candidatus Binataceae bacterium]|nr:sigma 54-interacting transcriptional regulator [Candidatus Binataceae bacterium]